MWIALLLIFSGAQVSRISAASLSATGRPLDIAIEGNGFFLLREPVRNIVFASRAGRFVIDASGYLVAFKGLRLQGVEGWSSDTIAISDLKLSPRNGAEPAGTRAEIKGIVIDEAGRISVTVSDGSTQKIGRIVLQDFSSPEGALSLDFAYRESSSLQALALPGVPMTAGLGRVRSGFLEIIAIPLAISASIPDRLAQAAIQQTGGSLHGAILGLGFFPVKDPASGAMFATRSGAFQIDGEGFIGTHAGLRLQGLISTGNDVLGDLQIDPMRWQSADGSTPAVVGLHITGAGRLEVELSNGRIVTGGQIVLQRYRSTQLLRPVGEFLYANLDSAEPAGPPALPGIDGAGMIIAGALEDLKPHSDLWLTLKVIGRLGSEYVIQASSEFRTWEAIGSVSILDYTAAEFLERQILASGARYYRVVVASR